MSRPVADVCLVIEGSYPYITGGVASWVQRLLLGLPDVSFALLIIMPDPTFAKEDRYPVPPNVIAREHIYLFDTPVKGSPKEPSAEFKETLEALHAAPSASRCPFVGTIDKLWQAGGLSTYSLQTARSSWDFIARMYAEREREVSFLDYFWTWRAIHGPMFKLFDAKPPLAHVWHPLSTGYAGFLASLAQSRHGGGLLLSEHGIYTRERDIEIAQAEWIYTEPQEGSAYAPTDPFFKRWWREQYRFLGRVTYAAADRVVALNDVNRAHQVAAGAPEAKLVNVPNGVHVERYAPLRAPRDWSDRPFRIGLIGRVVPIKDVKTFLRAVQIADMELPIEAFVLGPLDEDPVYAAECQSLVELLEIESAVTFTGSVNVEEWLPELDLIVLTSVSESQPLVVLEAAAAGIPSVCTHVGGCRELLEGRPGEDALLGPSGIITPVASPAATGAAIVALARDPERHAAMGRAALARVERHYHEQVVYDAYRALYQSLAKSPVGGAR